MPEDAPRINDLFVEMLQTIYQKPDVSSYESGDLDRFFCGQGDWICVAEAEGQVIAFLSMEEHPEQGGFVYLDDFSVSRDYRNCGIGSELLRTAERYARERGVSALVLHIEKSNLSACRLYKRFGFEMMKDEGCRLRMIKQLE